jgi:hypothetical protein
LPVAVGWFLVTGFWVLEAGRLLYNGRGFEVEGGGHSVHGSGHIVNSGLFRARLVLVHTYQCFFVREK